MRRPQRTICNLFGCVRNFVGGVVGSLCRVILSCQERVQGCLQGQGGLRWGRRRRNDSHCMSNSGRGLILGRHRSCGSVSLRSGPGRVSRRCRCFRRYLARRHCRRDRRGLETRQGRGRRPLRTDWFDFSWFSPSSRPPARMVLGYECEDSLIWSIISQFRLNTPVRKTDLGPRLKGKGPKLYRERVPRDEQTLAGHKTAGKSDKLAPSAG
jgi:hypothetical protein